jgi:signal transduction histidine kinase
MPNGSNSGQLDGGRDRDFPIAIATISATAAQRQTAVGVIIVLMIVAALVAPFADRQLGPIDAFIPVLQTVLAVADLITALLLFAQYVIVPQQALLAVASAYLCSASFAFLQTLTFPGGYAAAGLIGDGSNSPAWFFVLWHLTFPLGILVYALMKDGRKTVRPSGRSAEMEIGVTVVSVVIAVAGLAWLVTVGVGNLPAFYKASVVEQTRLGNQVNVGLLLWYAAVLAVLFARRRTILDVWLIVVLVAWLPNFLVAALASSVRFSLGWYAARSFALIASFLLLGVMLTEMTLLYSRLANAFALLRRERANRLMSVDAATAAIAHEVRTPLAAITLNANSARAELRSAQPSVKELDAILKDIEMDAERAGEVIAGVRTLFSNRTDSRTRTHLADCVRKALSLSQPELLAHQVSVTTSFLDNQALVGADTVQLQQVILNLITNAIDAMSSVAANDRELKMTTEVRDGSAVLIVQDAGPGIPATDHDRIFDAFFTTKRSGTGLGLALGRTIVESHGGELRLAGLSGSKGSTFEIVLPISSIEAESRPTG